MENAMQGSAMETGLSRKLQTSAKESQVWGALNRQEGELSALLETLDLLTERLGSVLSPRPENPMQEAPLASPDAPQLAVSIGENTMRVMGARRKVDRILGELDL